MEEEFEILEEIEAQKAKTRKTFSAVLNSKKWNPLELDEFMND